jgi:hypothetical protein
VTAFAFGDDHHSTSTDPAVAQAISWGRLRGKNSKGAVVKKRMKPWYCISLGDGMMAPMPTAEIEEAFLEAFAAAGKPSEMAVFTRPESEGRLHCEVMAYFSPAAQEVAEAFDGEPCGKPVRAGLGLLAGREECWSVLFPEVEKDK